MWKIIKKIVIVFEILMIVFLVSFFVLGKKERECYLKISFYPPLSYTNNYVYNFQVEYYTQVFRNSDIYGVYINTNSLPDYIKELQVEKGIRYGRIISNKELGSTIENLKYTLKFKFKFLSYMFIFIVVFFILIFSSKINSVFINIGLCNIAEIKYLWVFIVFLSALLLPKVVYTVFYKYFNHENLDNRRFNEYPNIQSNFIDFPKNYEAYFNDHLPFRNELIILKKDIDSIFNEGNVLGTNGHTYHETSIKYHTGETDFTIEELDIIKNTLVSFRDELRKRNINFILFIAPNKESIYYEGIPNYIRLKEFNTIDKLILYLKENSDINVIYPKDTMIKYKNNYELFYFDDSHWSSIAGYIGYLELMNNLGLTNNLVALDKVNIYEKEGLDKYILSNYTTNKFTILEGSNNHYYSGYDCYYSYSESDSSINTNILFLRDSFGYHMFNYIASSFKSTIYLHSSVFNIDYIKNRNIDLVVYELAEYGLRDLLAMTNWRIDYINK